MRRKATFGEIRAEERRVIEAELDAIKQASPDGHIEPEAVVTRASNSSSPLHRHFEWNDAVAGQAHRIEQARQLIRRVRYLDTTIDNYQVKTVKYIRSPFVASDKPGYVSIDSIDRKSEHARVIIKTEIDRALAALERAKSIAEVIGLDDEISRIISAIETLRRDRRLMAIAAE